MKRYIALLCMVFCVLVSMNFMTAPSWKMDTLVEADGLGVYVRLSRFGRDLIAPLDNSGITKRLVTQYHARRKLFQCMLENSYFEQVVIVRFLVKPSF